MGFFQSIYGLSILLSVGGLGSAVQAADLEVTVHELRSDRGHVLVALCTPETFLGAGCPFTASARAAAGSVPVMLRGVIPGVYAVQVFHDENDNLDIDRTFLGFPKEGMGFGNDAPMRYGPPSFEDAAVPVGEAGKGQEAKRVELRMRYFD